MVKRDLLLSSILHPSNFKIWLHSVDLSNPLKEFDYKQITDFMNMYNGKFADVWKSEKDGMRNIEKLALFVRSLHHLENPKQIAGKINKLEFFKNLQEEYWTTCMDGIVNRPKEVIPALMQYKYDSIDINNAVLEKSKFSIINNFVQAIKDFLNKQVIKNDIKTYRGEKDFRIFGNTRLSDARTLKDAIEDATVKIENGELGEKEIEKFKKEILLKNTALQNRFMSTAIIEEDTEKYAKKVLWYLDIPKGTKASFIEGYNVERDSESEILVQAGARLLINDAIYDFKKHRWKIQAEVSTALEKSDK